MRVGMDFSPALLQNAGIARYARDLAIALVRAGGELELALYYSAGRAPASSIPKPLSNLQMHPIRLNSKGWRLAILFGFPFERIAPRVMAGLDIIHATDTIAPRSRLPLVSTIHDLSPWIYPEHHTHAHSLYMRYITPRILRRAGMIITDSSSTRDQILDRWNPDDGRVRVVPLAVNHMHFRPIDENEARSHVEDHLEIDGPYILSVATLEPRKNIPTLLRAYATLPHDRPRLVLAGSPGWGNQDLLRIASDLGIREDLILTGFVPEESLPYLYSAAEVFAYPSLYEGFGFPVLEAMACGTPVVTSRRSSLPEVAGDAALLVDPQDQDELSASLTKVIQDADLRSSMERSSLDRASKFTWEATARSTIEVYQSVLS